MAKAFFYPDHSSVDGIFTGGTTYNIPPYQRPYSWQSVGKSDKNNQVIQMWDDLWLFFSENPDNNMEYFLGSMVVIADQQKLRTFEVIDGQQRLTTLLLLFAAMRCFLREVNAPTVSSAAEDQRDRLREFFRDAELQLERLLYNVEGLGLRRKLKLKIERREGAVFDLDSVLNQAIDCQAPARLQGSDRRHREVALRYFQNRDYFINRMRQTFLTAGALTEDQARRFDQFALFLQRRVALVVIKTEGFQIAYRIFEILNNRGLPLTNLDLLRNFLIKELADQQVTDAVQRWERLERSYAFTEDFVNRWTESINGKQPQFSAFNDLQIIYQREYRDSLEGPRVLRFYQDLEQDLGRYTLLMEEERIEDLDIRSAVRFVRRLDNERYNLDLLLALFRAHDYRGAAHAEVLQFLLAYRRWGLYFQLVPASGRFPTRQVYAAISQLRQGHRDQAHLNFVLDDGQRAKLALSLDEPIPDNETAKLLLAACIWDEQRAIDDVVSLQFDYEKATLEHIIPQDPDEGTNWLADFTPEFRKHYTYRVGNMTLLTQRMNSSNRHFDFSKKAQNYRKTHLPMTRELGQLAMISKEYIEQRHRELLAKLRALFEV